MPNSPNIILILTDHFRRDALGPATPHLDALARRGVNFANAYCASPLCMPSRNNITTGLHNSQTGICGNQAEPLAPHLRHDTFMVHLQEAGYQTALIGKHHFIDRYGLGVDVRKDDDMIKDYGFHRVFQVVDDGENAHNDDEYTASLRRSGRLDEFREALAKRTFHHPFPADETADGFIGTSGIRFVEEYEDRRPFYLNLSFVGPHPPYWHPDKCRHDPASLPAPLGRPDNDQEREMRAHYLEKCSLIDDYVGRLVAALERRSLLDNTVIIFTSDHGDCLGDFGIWNKRFFYESSVGIPLLMAGPGTPREERFNGPRVSKALASLLDLYPTILALAGASGSARRRDGCNLLNAFQEGAWHRREIVSELHTSLMIRTGNWKLVYDPEAGGVQHLYNLINDPKELNNLAGIAGYEAITAHLMERLLANRIRLTQYTHVKEEQGVQRVRVAY